jgi:RNA polymerase sigma-70 factor (ECF subfamily)
VHCNAPSFEETDWSQIVTLYDHLYAVAPTPVVALNRAIAIAEIDGPVPTLELIEEVTMDLDNYHRFHAVRGTYLRRLGPMEAAAEAFRQARDLATTDRERRFLAEQVEASTRVAHD